MFSKEELERYSRHLIIPEFNIEGQLKLKEARVLVVGSGGLGSPVLLYLAAAGVGTIGIVDFDVVDESNLQRQVLFGVEDVGMPKVEAARKRLASLNPHINIIAHNEQLHSGNALEIIKGYDLVADGTDNFPTRYLVNDACVILNKPNVYASIYRFEGQASVFNFVDKSGNRGPNYRDLFPAPPPPGLVPSCAEGGVIGVLPGILGTIQASEVIKVITGIGEPLSGRLFLFDALSFSTRILKIIKDPNTPKVTKLIDYQQFCGITVQGENAAHLIKEQVPSIDVQTLDSWRNIKKDFQLIDVRENYEYKIANLDGDLIPLGDILNRKDEIRRDVDVVVHCRSGKRSAEAIELLRVEHGYNNLYNLEGGILAWAKQVDHTMPQY